MGKKKDPVAIADEMMRNGGEEAEGEREPQAPKWARYDELQPIVSELIEMYPEQLSHIKPSSIGYAAFSKKKSKALAKIYPMRPMFGLFNSIDYILTVHLESWVTEGISKKYVLILHELLHIPLDGFDRASGDYRKTVDHDVKDFDLVVEKFGNKWENSEKILKDFKLKKTEVVESN